MRAALHREHGGPEVLHVEEVDDPRPGDGDVLLRVLATSVNHLDVQQRRGPALMGGFSLPHIPGMDLSGEVLSVGRDVTGVVPGERVVVNPRVTCGTCASCADGDDAGCVRREVVGASMPGGYAELCVVPRRQVLRLPDHVDAERAAALPTTLSTAWRAIVGIGRARAGEVVLINGAASGVSTIAVQLARRCGARVIAVARSDEKLARAASLGADVLINSEREDVAERARAATDGRGVDMVLDHVGPALFDPLLRSLRRRGRLVFCGATTGNVVELDLGYAYRRGIALLGVDAYRRREFVEMLEWAWINDIDAVIHDVVPLEEAASAHARVERGDVIGKILIRP